MKDGSIGSGSGPGSTARPRGTWGALAVAVVAVVAGFGWWVGPGGEPPAAEPSVALASVTGAAPAEPLVAAPRNVARAASAVSDRRAPEPADELAAGPPGTVPVCGAGRVPTGQASGALAAVAQRHAETLAKVARGMARSDVPRVRAVGLYLAAGSGDGSNPAFDSALAAAWQAEVDACDRLSGPSTTDSPACETARAARAAAEERHERTVQVPQHQALIRMAATSDDPAVVAIALQACVKQREGRAPCDYALLQRWARLDPDNGWTALELLGPALRAGDRGAVDVALGRIATAPRFESPDRAFLGVLLAALPGDAAPDLRTVAAIEFIGRAMAWSASGPSGLRQACSEAAVADVDRRQACMAATDAIAARGDDLLLLTITAVAGGRSGWEPTRAAHLRSRAAGLDAARIHWLYWGAASVDPRFAPSDVHASAGCGMGARAVRLLERRAAEGEAAALDRLLAQDGVDWRIHVPKR